MTAQKALTTFSMPNDPEERCAYHVLEGATDMAALSHSHYTPASTLCDEA